MAHSQNIQPGRTRPWWKRKVLSCKQVLIVAGAHLGGEGQLWGLEGIVGGEVDGQEEDTTLHGLGHTKNKFVQQKLPSWTPECQTT